MDKEKIIRKVNKISPKFNFVEEKTFSMNEIENTTLIFEYEGSKFVFIDGKENVELGWDYSDNLSDSIVKYMKNYAKDYYDYILEEEKDIIEYYESKKPQIIKSKEDEETIQQVNEELEEELEYINEQKELLKDGDLFVEKFKTYLNECTSPIRKVNIKPMLVEIDNNYLEQDMTYEEILDNLNKTIFRLPTEDEWEYICSGGKRTIFRWGNILNENINDEIYLSKNNNVNTILDKPNMFGVFISYNSYTYEVIDDEIYLKGGDGGSSICGGDGPIYVFPCFSSFYRYKKYSNKFSKNYYKIRRILTLD